MAISAAFTVNGAANPAAHTAAYGSTVTLQLSSVSGVQSVTFSIVGVSKSGMSIPAITAGGIPSGATSTFVLPTDPGDGQGRAYRVKCVVRNGYESDTRYAVVGAANAVGILPLVAGEELDRSASVGWVDGINEAFIAAVDYVETANNIYLTAASLRSAVASLSIGATVHTVDALTLGDGGGASGGLSGYWEIVARGSLTDNVWGVVTDGGSNAAVRRYPGAIYTAWGGTQSTALIQSCLTACSAAGGGVVELPRGTISVTGVGGNIAIAMTGLSNVTLRGQGRGVTVLRLANTADSHVINIDGGTNLAVEDLTIDGNSANQTVSVHGLRIGTAGVAGLTVQRVLIQECFGYGIGLQGGTKTGIRLVDVDVDGTGSDGIDLKNTDDNNDRMFLQNITVRDFGRNSSLSTQAGIDIRGPVNAHGLFVSEFGRFDCVGVRLREGALLDASGFGGHRSHIHGVNVTAGSSTGGSNATQSLVVNADDVSISGGYLSGGFRNLVAIGARLSVTGVSEADADDDGILLGVGADDARLVACHTKDGDTGIRVRSANVSLIGCTSVGAATAGVITESGATSLSVVDLTCEGTGGSMLGVSIASTDTKIVGGTIIDCFRGISSTAARTTALGVEVVDSLDDGILFAVGADDSDAFDCRVRGSGDAGVRLRADNCRVMRNRLTGGVRGLAIESGSDNNTHSNNVYSGNTTDIDNSGSGTRPAVVSGSATVQLRGDVAATLTAGDAETQIWNTTLTASRVVTLSTTGAWNGAQFRITRTGGGGGHTLDVGGLATLNQNDWCVVTYNGTAWEIIQKGTL